LILKTVYSTQWTNQFN